MDTKMKFSNSSSTLSYLLNQIKTVEFGGLDLRPDYQRGLVWKSDFKDKLIYSIIKGYPIGNISIRKLPNRNTKGAEMEVVDGQQRLNAIKEFTDNNYKIKNEWSKKIIIEIKKYFDSASKKDEKLNKLLKKLNNKSLNLSFRELPDIIQGNFENYDVSVSYISDASEPHIREYFRFLQNQERLRAGEIINSMPPTNLEKYKNLIDSDKFLKCIDYLDNRREFDKIFYSIIGLLDEKLNFGVTDKKIQKYSENAEQINNNNDYLTNMIEQINIISQFNNKIIKISRKRTLKYLLLLMAFGHTDSKTNSREFLENLLCIDDKLSTFFSAKPGEIEKEFPNYSDGVVEELRLIALLSKGEHTLRRVKNRIEALDYYIKNKNEVNVPSNKITETI